MSSSRPHDVQSHPNAVWRANIRNMTFESCLSSILVFQPLIFCKLSDCLSSGLLTVNICVVAIAAAAAAATAAAAAAAAAAATVNGISYLSHLQCYPALLLSLSMEEHLYSIRTIHILSLYIYYHYTYTTTIHILTLYIYYHCTYTNTIHILTLYVY